MTEESSYGSLRQGATFVLMSYLAIAAHVVAVLLGPKLLRSPLLDALVGVFCIISAAVLILRLNDRVAQIPSVWVRSVASLLVFPAWFVYLLINVSLTLKF